MSLERIYVFKYNLASEPTELQLAKYEMTTIPPHPLTVRGRKP